MKSSVAVLLAVVFLLIGTVAGLFLGRQTAHAVPRVAVPPAEQAQPLLFAVGQGSPLSPTARRFPCGHLIRMYVAKAGGSEWGTCTEGHPWAWYRGRWDDSVEAMGMMMF
jgi:hypothetical protein